MTAYNWTGFPDMSLGPEDYSPTGLPVGGDTVTIPSGTYSFGVVDLYNSSSRPTGPIVYSVNGDLTIGPDGSFPSNVTIKTGGTLDVFGDFSLDGTMGVFLSGLLPAPANGQGSVSVSGTLNLDAEGYFSLEDGSLSFGTLIVGQLDAALDLIDGSTAKGSDLEISNGQVLVGGDTTTGDALSDVTVAELTITDGAPLDVGADGQVTVTGATTDTGDIEVAGAGAEFDTRSLALQGVVLSVVVGGYVAIGGGTSGPATNQMQIGSSGTLIGHGRITSNVTNQITVGSTATIDAWSLTIGDNGTIEAQDGALTIQANVSVSATGQILIDSDSTLELSGTVAQGSTVTFQSDGTGTLILDDPEQFLGSIAGVQVGDQIILQNTNAGNGNGLTDATLGLNGGEPTLQIQESGQQQLNIPIDTPDIDNGLEQPPGVADEFFNVTQGTLDNATTLTLQNGNPIDLAVNGENVPSGLTGQGITIGVISGGLEINAMESIIDAIAPNVTFDTRNMPTAGANSQILANAIDALVSDGCDIIVDDVTTSDVFTDPYGLGGVPFLGGFDFGDPAATAVQAAYNAGITYVTATGNYQPNITLGGVNFSSKVVAGHNASPFAITVASTNWLAIPATTDPGFQFGGYITPPQTDSGSLPGGPGKPDLTAPDGGPTNNGLNNGLDPFFGTSAAAPVVAAITALMMSKNDQLETNPALVKQILNTTAAGLPGVSTVDQGNGLVQADAAVEATPNPTAYYAPDPPTALTVLSAALSLPAGDVDTGTTIHLSLTMTEGVTVTGGSPEFTLNDGGTATYDATESNPSIGTLVFDITAGATDYAANLAVTGAILNGATIEDTDGGLADFSGLPGVPTGVSVNSPLVVTSVVPSQNGEVQPGQTAQLTLTLSEPVTIDAAGGPPVLTLSNGANASYDAAASMPSAGALVFDYTVGASDDPTPNLSVAEVSLPAGTTVRDANGDNADFSGASDFKTGLQIGSAFAAQFMTSQTGAAIAGQVVQLTVGMSEPVTVDTSAGSPTLTLDDGATATYDATASNPTQGSLVFNYTVRGEDQTPALEIAQVSLNGASIRDGNGVNANFATVLNFPAELTINSPLVVTGVASSQTGEVAAGQTIQLTITMSEAVTVDTIDDFGTAPSLTLNDGATATYDGSASNPSGGTLAFDYTVGTHDETPNLAISQVNLPGPIFYDSQGNLPDFSAALNVATGTQIGPLPRVLAWTGDRDTNFATAADWDDITDDLNPAQTAPDEADTIEFNTGEGGVTGSGTITVLEVGSTGTGVLRLSDGASIVAGSLDAGVGSADVAQIGLSGAGTDLSVTGSATIADDGTGILSVLSGATFAAANLTIGSQEDSSGAVVVSGQGSTINISGDLNVGTAFGTGDLTIGPGGGVNAAVVNLQGQVILENGELDPAVNLINQGQTAGGSGTIAAGDIVDEGMIEAGGKLVVSGTVLGGGPWTINGVPRFQANGGAGVLQIDAGGTLELTGPVLNAGSTTFTDDVTPQSTYTVTNSVVDVNFEDATGVLKIDDIAGFAGTISAFQKGDSFVITGGTLSNLGVNGGTTLTVSDSGNGGTDHLIFASSVSGSGFSIVNNDTIQVACFAAGTRIETTAGPVAVEMLAVGDEVRTLLGGSGRIVWVGSRAVHCARHPRPETVWPVRIARSTFAENVPVRDLFVSPDHAIYIDGVLIPAKRLLNGTTVRQIRRRRVVYHHIELAHHDVVLAEGVPAETYLDAGDRAKFSGGRMTMPHAGLVARMREATVCAPLIAAGRELKTVRQRVNARAASRPRPREKPPEAQPFRTRSLGVPDCWGEPDKLPDTPHELGDGPKALTAEQEKDRTKRWPGLW